MDLRRGLAVTGAYPMSFIYIASPYTHLNPLKMEERFKLVENYIFHLTLQNVIAYSPIVHFHQIAKEYTLPTDAEFWYKHNVAFLKSAKALHVLQLPGWDMSKGIIKEIKVATMLHLPIFYQQWN